MLWAPTAPQEFCLQRGLIKLRCTQTPGRIQKEDPLRGFGVLGFGLGGSGLRASEDAGLLYFDC